MSTDFSGRLRALAEAMATLGPARPATRKVALAMRPLKRLADTPGDRHIERIIRDCLARRLDPAHTARRLMVASDLARLLDGRNDR